MAWLGIASYGWAVSGKEGSVGPSIGEVRDSKESGMDRQGRLRTAKVRTSQAGHGAVWPSQEWPSEPRKAMEWLTWRSGVLFENSRPSFSPSGFQVQP